MKSEDFCFVLMMAMAMCKFLEVINISFSGFVEINPYQTNGLYGQKYENIFQGRIF